MLKCYRARKHFADLLDGVANSRQKAFVLDHLKRCPRCSSLFDELKRVDGLVREGLKEIPYVDWEAFEKDTLDKTMEKLSRRGRLKKRAKSG